MGEGVLKYYKTKIRKEYKIAFFDVDCRFIGTYL